MERSFKVAIADQEYLYRCYTQSPLLHMCSHLISTQILSNGISFCRGGCKTDKLTVDAKLSNDIEEVWIPFTRRALDSILCYGFVVVSVDKGVPEIMNVGQYHLEVTVGVSNYSYRVMSVTAVDDEIPNTIVFDNFGFRLTPSGSFTSLVHKVIPRLLFLKRLRETAVAMEIHRAENTVFTEIQEKGNKESTEGVDYDFYADSNTAKITEDMKFQRNSLNVSVLNQQLDLYDKYLGKAHAKKAEKSLENVVPLPNGQHLVSGPQNTGRGDYGGIHKTITEDICSALGVPRAIIQSEGGGGLGSKSDSDGQHEVFQATVRFYKNKLGIILSHVYNTIHAKAIKKTIDFSKYDDVYEAKQKNSVQVYFPVTPFVSNESLRQLYEQGVIDFKTYAKYALANVNLPDDDLNKKYLKNGPPIDALLFERPPTPVQNVMTGGGANLNSKRKAEQGKSGGEKSTKKKKTSSETSAET
jgi:CRISPR/Cas system CMR-associated protein Cmr5 small subunit